MNAIFSLQLLLALILVALPPQVFAAGAVHTVAQVANAQCLEPNAGSANQLGYSVSGGTAADKALIDRVVNTLIQNNSNELQNALRGVQFQVRGGSIAISGLQAAGVARYGSRTIELDGSKISNTTTGAAVIAHEICHFIGNSRSPTGAGTNYQAYNSAVPASGGRCVVSTYCQAVPDGAGRSGAPTSRAEEFAEVCSANLVAPGHAQNQNTNACDKASAFMRNSLFGAPSPDCSASRNALGWRDSGGNFVEGDNPSGGSLFSCVDDTGENDDTDEEERESCTGTGEVVIPLIQMIVQHQQQEQMRQQQGPPRIIVIPQSDAVKETAP